MPNSLANRITLPGVLETAWKEIHAKAQAEGRLAPNIARFAADAESKFDRLRADLAEGSYRPLRLNRVEMTKPISGVRELDVPPLSDRVVERAVLNLVNPFVDPNLSPAAYGYRPGLGVVDAVQSVVDCREAGLIWVLRTDIHDCFPSIPRDLALERLLVMLPDHSLDELITMFASRRSNTPQGVRDIPGLPQGTSLSPLLANVALSVIDDELLDQGFPTVRYADDVVVTGRTKTDMERAYEVAATTAKSIGMSLGGEKTEIMDFAQGFSFLGQDFGLRYPPLSAIHRVRAPLRQVVYVGLQGSYIFSQSGRLIVQSKNKVKVINVPTSHVQRIVCFGSVAVSSGVRAWALYNGIDVIFLSRKGSYQGQQLAASPTRLSRLRAQLAVADDPERSLAYARQVVVAKIRHQVKLVQRFNLRETSGEAARRLDAMRLTIDLATSAPSRESLMGVEGVAAKTYFEAMSLMLPEDLQFNGRSRRPPRDVFNSAISYLYAILLGECVSALVAAGLDPAIGMFHAEQDRRNSLALDLMEEFRPYAVDQVVLRLARKGTLTAEHGETRPAEGGVYVNKAGKEILIDGYEKRMLQITSGALPDFSGSIRRHMYRQAERVAAYIGGSLDVWTGLSWR
jgi:CRISPR-associated protein Cas1